MNKLNKLIFVTGGVSSSLGKGVATAAIGSLLQAHGHSITIKKLDPYLNVDPGTMSPLQHGEVFVTQDGTESDLDLGHYERFTDIVTTKDSNITSGKIYSTLIEKERKGDYLGSTIQVIPHVTNLIKDFILQDYKKFDFTICEIGGTVGDIESLPFVESIRQLRQQFGSQNCAFVHLTLLPYIAAARELKSKPTQHSVKDLMSLGIIPDILICRSEKRMDAATKAKIALFCNVDTEAVIDGIDVDDIYEIPTLYARQNLDTIMLQKLNVAGAVSGATKKADLPDLQKWHSYLDKKNNPKHKIRLAVAGKYTSYKDSYKSLIEAINHASIQNNCQTEIVWLDTKILSHTDINKSLEGCSGVIVPGGFGHDGTDNKISAIRYARKYNLPFLGICLGMQLAVIEFARSVLNIESADSTEFNENCKEPIVYMLNKWQTESGATKTQTAQSNKGGSMRLGNYEAVISKNTKLQEIYAGANTLKERHRHRFEVNNAYTARLNAAGMVVSAFSKTDSSLPECIEIKGHQFFVGCQFHPEFSSRPFRPNPLFNSLIQACINAK